MSKTFFVLPNVRPNPYSSTEIEAKHPKPLIHLESMFGHFDDFSLRNFIAPSFIDSVGEDSLVFVVVFIYLPISAEFSLDKKLIKRINKNPNTHLLFISLYESRLEIEKLVNECSGKNIRTDKVVLASSNYKSHMTHQAGIRCIYMEHWESYSRYILKLRDATGHTNFKTRLETIKNAKKKFISLNRNVKHHRLWWYFSICKNKMIKEGHVSYNLPDIDRKLVKSFLIHPLFTTKLPKHIRKAMSDEDELLLMTTKKLDEIDSSDWIINWQDSITEYYRDSLLSIVTESEEKNAFLTEKTYKAISHHHPFFIIGNPEHHEILRKKGYHTFENLFGINQVTNFDEATMLLDNLKRLSLKELKNLVLEKYKNQIKENYENYLSRTISWNDVVRDLNNATRRIVITDNLRFAVA